MTERERLIELIKQKQDGGSKYGDNILHETKCSNAELADYLLENGVIVPPVKVETTVYYTDSYRHLIKPLEIIGFEVDYTKRICKYYCRGGDYTPAWFKPAEIGKTIFLTREEAEKALVERSKQMIDFTITAIKSIELYDNGMEIVKKNVPDAIKVSASTFRDFCQGKNLDSHPNTISEQTAYLDEYGNVVAGCIWGHKGYNDTEYLINPELYELSHKQKKLIKDEYAQVREPKLVMTLNDVKSVKID